MDSTAALTAQCREQALELGFDVCGFSSVDVELHRDYYLKWIEEKQHGTMEWMERNNDRRLEPRNILPEARSIVVVGLNYYQDAPEMRGTIAKYALGKDYHKIMYKRLKRLCSWMREQGGAQKPYVDTGPVLEKPIAAEAGLGWVGKSTLLLHRKFGTFMFLGAIVTTLDLKEDSVENNHCGSCTRCLDICPTNAFPAPYKLDATKCISYLTIEHQGSIPMEYREAIGDRVYGCDDCLDVCPWNRWAQKTREARFLFPGLPDLAETLAWDEETFTEHFQRTPIKRLKLPRWKRNVCVVLGNIGTSKDLKALQPLAQSEDEMVAEHARWAIDKIEERSSACK
ncbi:tRNA epoxyqueuosine(34) reductase QueG [Opitutia bacterium ISCC 51]|nr:tRNA epoxyqueuosine(34) reductase QueG [Opitutae bacterium ISCC 51]QXD29662.1 tRNA epoxyqueuosine(34) reductase QueG [Opitutae bacterium ISCC 52]